MNTNKISTNFKFSEFEKSEKAQELGIDNHIPNESVRWCIRMLVINLLQPLRDLMEKPIHINSGYRSRDLNIALKGAIHSQHMRGEAVDIAAPDPLLLAQIVQRNGLPFDQMILYSNFVHLSHNTYGPQRKQIIFHKTYKEKYPQSKRK